MTHSDDNGLVLPPALAPIQVVIIPIGKGDQMPMLDEKAEAIVKNLKAMGISVKYDNADNKRPGFKFADYELKGVPVRLVLGARDLEQAPLLSEQAYALLPDGENPDEHTNDAQSPVCHHDR